MSGRLFFPAAAALLLSACQYTEEIAQVPPGEPVFPYAQSTCGECRGCCRGIFCEAGNTEIFCGKDGAPCEFCMGTKSCVNQVCTTCGPSNCAGCCNGIGQCVSGTAATACGRGGEACQLCGGFQECVRNACN